MKIGIEKAVLTEIKKKTNKAVKEEVERSLRESIREELKAQEKDLQKKIFTAVKGVVKEQVASINPRGFYTSRQIREDMEEFVIDEIRQRCSKIATQLVDGLIGGKGS